MGREFELKYRCSEESFANLLADFQNFTPIEMETTYYDTADGRLGSLHWTLRRRFENGKSVCTLKTPSPDGGRGEWEVEMDAIENAIPELCKLGGPETLRSLCAWGVTAVCGAKFTRQAKTLEIPGATVELALDRGKLLGGGQEMDLLEVEVELKAGADEAAIDFAGRLAEQYALVPENRSKYRRALGLARGEYHV